MAKNLCNKTRRKANVPSLIWGDTGIGKSTIIMNNKLYVWEDVLTDYTSGIIVALAPNIKEARKLVYKKEGRSVGGDSYFDKELSKKPKVITKPRVFVIWGGG